MRFFAALALLALLPLGTPAQDADTTWRLSAATHSESRTTMRGIARPARRGNTVRIQTIRGTSRIWCRARILRRSLQPRVLLRHAGGTLRVPTLGMTRC